MTEGEIITEAEGMSESEVQEETFESSSAEETSNLTEEQAAYQDASWEIIGELSPQQDFTPIGLEEVESRESHVDPLFPDYGGSSGEEQDARWNLKKHLAGQPGTGVQTEEEEGLLKLKEEELEAIKEEAREAGRQGALEEARQEQEGKIKQFEESMKTILDDLQTQINEHQQEIEKSAVELSLNIAHKLVGDSVEINPEYIVSIINEALGQVGTAVIKKVSVSPEDMEFIEVLGIRKLISAYDESWDFEADPTVKSGCIVETSAGEIDYQLDKAWDRIREHVVKVVR